MRTLELFSGTASFSKVADSRGHDAFTVEKEGKFQPDLIADILKMEISDLPPQFRNPDIVWASPPCTSFSVSSIGHHWENKNGILTPKTKEAILGCQLVIKTIDLISELNPRFYFIENPRGMLRKMPFMMGRPKRTVTYCQYGDTRMKPTDIWTNCNAWRGRRACQNGDPCHERAPAGSKNGTQGMKDAMTRAVVPPELCEEIIMVCEGAGRGSMIAPYAKKGEGMNLEAFL